MQAAGRDRLRAEDWMACWSAASACEQAYNPAESMRILTL